MYVCMYTNIYHQYIKILCVCLSVCDGCGRGHNEFAGRVQNYHVPCAKLSRCHRNFLEIVKARGGPTRSHDAVFNYTLVIFTCISPLTFIA